jgi:hypothetical protein
MRVGTRAISALAVASIFALAPAAASAANTGLEAYKIQLKTGQLQELAKAGFDVTEARQGDSIEVVATAEQAAKLQRKGFAVTLKRNRRGETAQQFDARIQQDDGSYVNYRPYWDDTYVGRDADGRKRARRSTRSCASSPATTPTSSRPKSSAAASTTCRSWR